MSAQITRTPSCPAWCTGKSFCGGRDHGSDVINVYGQPGEDGHCVEMLLQAIRDDDPATGTHGSVLISLAEVRDGTGRRFTLDQARNLADAIEALLTEVSS